MLRCKGKHFISLAQLFFNVFVASDGRELRFWFATRHYLYGVIS